MRILFLLLALLFELTLNAQNLNTYAIFSEVPEKRISYTNINQNNYFIEFVTKKKATIYLELLKGDKPVAISRKIVKSKDSEITKLNLNPIPNLRIRPGSDYHLRLRMYEGEDIAIKNLVSEAVIDDVNLTRLLYTKL